MKKVRIVLNNIFDVEVPDDYNFEEDKEKDYEELNNIFADRLARNNETPNNLFWESIEVEGEIKNE